MKFKPSVMVIGFYTTPQYAIIWTTYINKKEKEVGKLSIKHTAVSYYGLNYVEHAASDFKEMKEHGCDTVT